MRAARYAGATDGTLSIAGDAEFPVNAGALCLKGFTAGETLAHPERLIAPLVRNAAGKLVPATLGGSDRHESPPDPRLLQRKHGRDAIGVFGGGSLTNEKVYLLGKFARVVLRTPHIDYNGRFCMSSAAAAGLRAFGLDRGLPFPVSDIAPRRRDPARRRERRRDDAADHAVLRGAAPRWRAADRRRSAADGHGRARDAAPAPDPGHRRRPRARPAARAHPRASDRRSLHPRAHRRLRGRARACRDVTGRSGSSG